MSTPSPTKLSVLIVDDEGELADELALSLREVGHTALVAASGGAAMEILHRNPDIGAVITDVRMPGTDGFSLARSILESTRAEQARRVIIMTGHASLDDASSAVRAGAFDYLRKPFELEAMLDAIERALQSAEAERQAHAQARSAEERLAQAEATSESMRLRDSVTGLPNAAALQAALASAVPLGSCALFMLRLEGLRPVMDAGWGSLHDGLMCEAAHRFSAIAGRHEVFALHDTAHFAVLARETGEEAAQELGRALAGALSQPLCVAGQSITLTASIGFATSPAAADTPLDACALVAASEAARQGAGRLVAFSSPMHGAALRRLRIAQDLPAAAAAGQLALHYQPLVATDRSALLGFEALMRWVHPSLGPVRPDEFIQVAEENATIIALGAWAAHEAAAQVARWRRAGPFRPYVTVNVSGRQLRESDVPALFAHALQEHGLTPDAMVVEVTETFAAGADAAEILQAVRRLGLRVALDDFGSGFSSLGALRRLPADIVKFDRSLLPSDQDAERERHFFIGLAQVIRGLGLKVVVEGVETAAQWQLAADAGADAVQGYAASRPLPQEQAAEFVRKGLTAS